MSQHWWYHEALAADRRAARRQLDLALSQPQEQPPAPQPQLYLPELCYYEQRGAKVNDHNGPSVGWMLVLLLMMASVILTTLVFIVLFVTGLIGGA